eukprot:69140-Pleurochrysis_carterae.AAC.3
MQRSGRRLAEASAGAQTLGCPLAAFLGESRAHRVRAFVQQARRLARRGWQQNAAASKRALFGVV